MKKILTYILSALLIIASTLGFTSANADAATPRVMLTDYEIKGKVIPGKDFDMELTLQNTAAKKITNLKVTVVAENGEFIPAEGAGTAYIAQIASKEEEKIPFKFKAINGLAQKSYKMNVTMEYAGSDGAEYTVTESIYVEVTLENKISVTDVFIENSDIFVGDSIEVTAKVNNLGEGAIRNVTVNLEGQTLAAVSSYVGNVEPGKSGNIDLVTKGEYVTDIGRDANKLIISYEDINGENYSQEVEISVNVKKPIYDELELIVENKKPEIKESTITWIILGFVAALVILFAIIRGNKKRKELDEMFK